MNDSVDRLESALSEPCDGGRRRFTTAKAAARLSVGKPTFARGRFSDSRFGRSASLLVVTGALGD